MNFFYCVQLLAMLSPNLRPNIVEWKKNIRGPEQKRDGKNQWSKVQRLLILGFMYPIKLQLDEI